MDAPLLIGFDKIEVDEEFGSSGFRRRWGSEGEFYFIFPTLLR
jgi:hypothetical protein